MGFLCKLLNIAMLMRKIHFHENGSIPVNNRSTQISSFYKPSSGSFIKFLPQNLHIKPGRHMFLKLKNISAFFLWLFMFLIPVGLILAQGQSFIVTGRVVGAENQLPLNGVTITVKGMRGGVTTDANGNFKVDAKSGTATLVFSYTGYV